MPSRNRLTWVCLLLILAASSPVLGGQEARRPNILLIIADDLGYADLGAYGSDIRTPNIDRLAAEGIRFTRFLTAPMCAPTRAMLYTGNNNHVAGMGRQVIVPTLAHDLAIPGYEGRLSDRVVPLSRVLGDAGYHTYFAGKWHLGDTPEHGPFAAGFDRSFSLLHGAGSHFSAVGYRPGGSVYSRDGQPAEWPAGAYSSELFTDELLGFIDSDREDGRPFFAVAAYTAPHAPLQVPDDYLHRYSGRYDEGYDVLRVRRFEELKSAGIVATDGRLPPRNPAITPWSELTESRQRVEARKMELYAALVENLDFHVGRLLDYLRRRDLSENTLVIFLSDNGAASDDFYNRGVRMPYVRAHYDNDYANMGRPGSWVSYGAPWAEASSAPFQRYKTFTLQGGIVSPMIIAGAGVNHTDVITDSHVTVMDIAPTLIDLSGGVYPAGGEVRPMLGETMLPLLSGRSDRVHDDHYVTTLYHLGRAFVRQGRWKLVTREGPFDESRFELYDLDVDPGEARDLKTEEPDVYGRMIELWREERRKLGIILPGDL